MSHQLEQLERQSKALEEEFLKAFSADPVEQSDAEALQLRSGHVESLRSEFAHNAALSFQRATSVDITDYSRLYRSAKELPFDQYHGSGCLS